MFSGKLLGITREEGAPTVTQEVTDEGQFARVLAPQPEDVVFPPHHLTEDEHHRDGGKADEKEEGIGFLHHVQSLLVSENLETGKEEGNHSRCFLYFLFLFKSGFVQSSSRITFVRVKNVLVGRCVSVCVC